MHALPLLPLWFAPLGVCLILGAILAWIRQR